MNASFDTLTYSKKLIAAGEKPEIAEIHAQTIRHMMNEELVTKSHLDMHMKEIDARFKETELKFDARFKEAELNADMRMKEIDARFKEIDMKFDAMENRLTIKLGGIMIAGVSILAVLMKVL